jgi:hypothetical protein
MKCSGAKDFVRRAAQMPSFAVPAYIVRTWRANHSSNRLPTWPDCFQDADCKVQINNLYQRAQTRK